MTEHAGGAVTEQKGEKSTEYGRRWYALSADEVATALAVDRESGLSASRAAELLAANGPNALPEERGPSGWRRFADQYRSYMQIILVAAAIVSLAVKDDKAV